MDKIINYLLLTIIFVFDPLAIALVIAANFAFEKLKKPTKENLYGETIEIDEDEANRRMRVISQNGNDGLHYRDEIESEPAEEFDDDSKTISDTEAQIQTLKKQIDKINLQDNTGKKASIAIADITQQIQKLRDEDNTITY